MVEPVPEQGINREPIGYCRPPLEHQFRPGVSGNPKGRPRGLKQALDSRRFLVQGENGELRYVDVPEGKTVREALFQVLAGRALGGSDAAMRELLDRAYGRVPQRQAQADGSNLPSAITVVEVHAPTQPNVYAPSAMLVGQRMHAIGEGQNPEY